MLVLTNLGYLWGWRYSQPELPFTGRPYESAYDASAYLSFLKQSQQGYLLYRYQFTPEEHPRIFFRPYWAYAGLVGRAFNVSPIITYHAMRLFTALILLLSLIYFLKYFFDPFLWQVLGFLFIGAGYGFGWLLFFISDQRALDLFSDAARVDAPFWSALASFPHLAFALTMMLFIIIFLGKALGQNNLKWAKIAGVLGLLLGLEHPFDLIPLSLVFGLWALELYRQKEIPGRSALKIMGIFVAFSWPALLYNYGVFHYNPALSSIVKQNVTPSLGPLSYIFGFGLVLLLAAVGGYDIAVNKNLTLYPFVIWALLLPFLLYLPLRFNGRWAEGSHIILGFLAAWGLKRFWETHPAATKKKLALALILVLLTLPTNFYYLYQEIRAYQKRAYPCFVPAGFLEGVQWLKSNTQPQEGVLSNYALGNLVPATAGNRVFLGHWCETGNFAQKEKLWENFLNKDWPEKERQQIFLRYNLQYLLFSILDRRGGYDPETSPYLQRVYQNPLLKIYKVVAHEPRKR